MRYSLDIHFVLIWCNLWAIYCEGALEWSYTSSEGPSTWSRSFSNCGGLHQSPVDIQSKETVFEDFEPLNLKYDRSVAVKMENNGHTVQCSIKSKVNQNLDISGGGLPVGSVFRATQLHFHWGGNISVGSEHKFNGKSLPLEMHVLHYNTKYKGLERAANESDGIAIVSVLFQLSSEDNPNLNAITQLLGNISYEGRFVEIDSLSVRSLLPSNKSTFYRYHGSFTTPGCEESVEWIIFKTPATVSGRQLQLFRQLFRVNSTVAVQNTKKPLLVNNFRPVQLLNQRIVRRNFDPPPLFCGRKDNTTATCSKLLRGRDVKFEVQVSPCLLPVGVFVGVTVPDDDFNWTHTFVTSLEDAIHIATLNYSLGIDLHSHGTGSLHVTVSQLDLLSEKARPREVISELFPVDQICSVHCTSTELKDCSRMIRSGNDTLEIGAAVTLGDHCDNDDCLVHVELFRREGLSWVLTGLHSFVNEETQQFDLTSEIVHSHERNKRQLVSRRSTQTRTTFKAEIKSDNKQVGFKLYLVVSNGIKYEVVSRILHPSKNKIHPAGGHSSKVVIGVVVVLVLVVLIGGVAYLLYRRRHYFHGHQPALVDEMANDDNITDNRL